MNYFSSIQHPRSAPQGYFLVTHPQRDGILPDERIGGGERQAVRLGLTHQHPVKGGRVQRGQSAQLREGFSFAFKGLQNVLRQWSVEISQHGELTLGEPDGAQLRQRRGADDGKQARGFFGQALRRP